MLTLALTLATVFILNILLNLWAGMRMNVYSRSLHHTLSMRIWTKFSNKWEFWANIKRHTSLVSYVCIALSVVLFICSQTL